MFDGEPTELLRAPIWNVWEHGGSVHARVDQDGGRIVRLDLGTGATTDVGTLPTDLRYHSGGISHVPRLEIAAGGAWGVLGAGSSEQRDLVRVALPSGAATATATPAAPWGWAQPLADGRLALVSRDAPLRLLDPALQPITGITLPVTAGLLHDAPDGAWFDSAEGTYRLTVDTQPPTVLDLHATAVLPQPADVALTAAPPDAIPVFTYEPSATAPPSASPSPGPAVPSPAAQQSMPAPAASDSITTPESQDPSTARSWWWPLLAVLAVAALLAARSRRRRRE